MGVPGAVISISFLGIWIADGMAPGQAGALILVFFGLMMVAAGVWWWRNDGRFWDIEYSSQGIALPFKKHRRRRGWRSYAEIRFLEIDANEGNVRTARRLLQQAKAGQASRLLFRYYLWSWPQVRGLIAITDDEVLWFDVPEPLAKKIHLVWRARGSGHAQGGFETGQEGH
jgi:hypothetical protein